MSMGQPPQGRRCAASWLPGRLHALLPGCSQDGLSARQPPEPEFHKEFLGSAWGTRNAGWTPAVSHPSPPGATAKAAVEKVLLPLVRKLFPVVVGPRPVPMGPHSHRGLREASPASAQPPQPPLAPVQINDAQRHVHFLRHGRRGVRRVFVFVF